jgi:hypothetical protein
MYSPDAEISGGAWDLGMPGPQAMQCQPGECVLQSGLRRLMGLLCSQLIVGHPLLHDTDPYDAEGQNAGSDQQHKPDEIA